MPDVASNYLQLALGSSSTNAIDSYMMRALETPNDVFDRGALGAAISHD